MSENAAAMSEDAAVMGENAAVSWDDVMNDGPSVSADASDGEMAGFVDDLSEISEVMPAATGRESCGFVVDSDEKAEWCLRRIRWATREKERWKKFYQEQCRKMEQCNDMIIAFMEGKLRAYFASVPHKATKTQESYTLPSGKLVQKVQGPSFDCADETVIAWLKENDGSEYIRTVEKLDWAALKKTLTVCGESVVDASGEVVPGIRAEYRPPVFRVELKKEEE